MVIHGESTFGKVDQVPNLFHVGTQFFHVSFVPLVPLKSDIIAGSETRDGFRGVPIPLNWKSVSVAWVRILLGVLFVAGSIRFDIAIGRLMRGPIEVSDAENAVLWFMWMVAVCIFYWLTYRFRRAGHLRAMRLGAMLGLDPVEVARFVHTQGKTVSSEPAPDRVVAVERTVAMTGADIPEGR